MGNFVPQFSEGPNLWEGLLGLSLAFFLNNTHFEAHKIYQQTWIGYLCGGPKNKTVAFYLSSSQYPFTKFSNQIGGTGPWSMAQNTSLWENWTDVVFRSLNRPPLSMVLASHLFNFFLTESETQRGSLSIPATTIAAVEVNGKKERGLRQLFIAHHHISMGYVQEARENHVKKKVEEGKMNPRNKERKFWTTKYFFMEHWRKYLSNFLLFSLCMRLVISSFFFFILYQLRSVNFD